MLNHLIELSIRHRVLVAVGSLLVLLYGIALVPRMPVDVLPDLNRPVVTVMTEAHGLAPEEVEALVSFPIETMMNGATGVQRVRSASSAGFSIVFVEFDWDTDLYRARQIVTEKLQLARERLPEGAVASLAPVSSIMGEIMLLSVSSKSGKTDPIDVRSVADFVLRPRLLSVPGVSQVVTIGGGVKQFQVLTNPERLKQYGVSLDDLEDAARESNMNAGGGFLQMPQREAVIRIQGRARTPEEIAETPVAVRNGVAITIGQVADVKFGPALMRGDAGVNGKPAVILSVQKQPNANTLELTKQVDRALDEIQKSLDEDLEINKVLFRQSSFIEAAIGNVVEALRDGTLLVLLIVALFLAHLRATFITMISIPMSFVLTILLMDAFGITINTMTLGGLAVAIGLVVDDSIVGVENVFRRLRENSLKARPDPPLRVIYRASAEVRNSIVFATLIIMFVFLPLLSLEGMEGRVFLPLGIAFIVSMFASLVVSLTLAPALMALMLRRVGGKGHTDDSWILRKAKAANGPIVSWSMRNQAVVYVAAAALFAGSAALMPLLGREFLPPFNEGSLSVTAILPPGTSLAESNRVGTIVEEELLHVPEVAYVGRRTGRAEMDDHAEGVNHSELDIGLKPLGRTRQEVEADIRKHVGKIPGLFVAIGQPISHRLDHLSSGVRAAIAVKVYGPELGQLRSMASQVRAAMEGVPGVVDLQVEPQIEVPQVSIEIDRAQAARYGLTPFHLAETLEVALGGHAVSQILLGQRTFDLVLWFDEDSRNSLDAMSATLVSTPTGARIPLGQVARVRASTGPNTINRENVSRRIVVQANVQGADLNSVVRQTQAALAPVQASWPSGYYVEYGGQFESQQSAMARVLLLGAVTVLIIFLGLYAALRSWRMASIVMVNLPLAALGGIVAVYFSGGVLSVASLVGFITLFGIATRNGILLLSHYAHLMREEGERFGPEMILRGTQERLSPVLMTALAAAFGMLPLAFAFGQPGKELLQPIALVICGGLISSTLMDRFVTPALFLRFGRKEWENYVSGTHVDYGGLDEIAPGDHILEEREPEPVGATPTKTS